MKTKEIVKLIEKDGWYDVRQNENHRQYKQDTKEGLVTIPIHRLSHDLIPGLEKSILKQAQIDNQ